MGVMIYFSFTLWIMVGIIWLVSRHREALENLTFSGTLYQVILWPISIWSHWRKGKEWKEFEESLDE